MRVHPQAGKIAVPSMLVNIPRLVTAYYTERPDPSVPGQRVTFGTSGHRGSAFKQAFNEAHILAISQAINPSKHEFYRNRGNLSVKIPANGSCSVNTKERTIPFTEQMTLRRILEN